MKAWRLKGTDYIQNYLPGEQGYEENVEDYERVHILTDAELKARDRRVWDAAREEILNGHPQIDGYTKKYRTLNDYEKSLEGGK